MPVLRLSRVESRGYITLSRTVSWLSHADETALENSSRVCHRDCMWSAEGTRPASACGRLVTLGFDPLSPVSQGVLAVRHKVGFGPNPLETSTHPEECPGMFCGAWAGPGGRMACCIRKM